jgi:hypothetical protein
MPVMFCQELRVLSRIASGHGPIPTKCYLMTVSRRVRVFNPYLVVKELLDLI